MVKAKGRAMAAANQIMRVGTDERGSILSTSYRQIDWLGDRNIQNTLSHSNFDLSDFLKGNMDIFIVLPEDQIKEHGRLFRMIMALLMSLIVSSKNLPSKKILFLLDEIAQLGYCPDVEQAIEVLRARNVVVWAVFQTLKQIELYKKPDLFKSFPIKQIFTNDDVDTMKWIQTLGANKTILSMNTSLNTGKSKDSFRNFSGNVSKGEGTSFQESAADLIPLDKIRELSINEQFVFVQGEKPIHCKKVAYFEHKVFQGKFDINPVENKS